MDKKINKQNSNSNLNYKLEDLSLVSKNSSNMDYNLLLKKLQDYGMDKRWSRMFVKKLIDDENSFVVDEATRKWAIERGFFPGRVELYGLTEENYKNYVPEFSYYMIHPINHHFRIWVNDKLTLKYVLNSCGCESSMPEYYLYVENNKNYTYLMDTPYNVKKDKDFLINLLKQKKFLAAKPNSGTSGGRGFMKWEWKDNQILINNKIVDRQEFDEITEHLENFIITEYVQQHTDLAKIWPQSECTLRIIMAKLPQKNDYDKAEWHNTVAYARFGTSVSGGASNLSSGGIGVAFDFETGKFKNFGIRYKKFCPDGEYICYEHPDSHSKWKECAVPNWNSVKKMIENICNHISSLDYLGIDVIVTEKEMKLCEINSHPAVDYEQLMCAPNLSDEKTVSFFKKHGLLDVKNSDFWEMYRGCISNSDK